jgi:hypothetical protein
MATQEAIMTGALFSGHRRRWRTGVEAQNGVRVR